MQTTYDVLVIGAGPAGIFTALELDRLAPEKRCWSLTAAAPLPTGAVRHARGTAACTARRAVS